MKDDASRPEKRNRFRKIEVRMWGDEKFKRLSPMPPCGQGLWVFLLTGPHTGPIPGVFRSGRAAMAEELEWELEAFDEAFGEAFREGLVKADWKAKFVWIPNAIKCNRPESPNVVRSWAAEWDLIPECDLKREAYESLQANICGLGESFEKAFREAFSKPSPKASPKPSRKTCGNQEQEQEQLTTHTPRARGELSTGSADAPGFPSDRSPSNPPTPPPNDAVEPTPAGKLCLVMRRYSINATPSNPTVIALAAQGIDLQTLEDACREAREAKPGESISINYIAKKLEGWARDAARIDVRGAGKRPNGSGNWRVSDAAIDEKCRELGISLARPGEHRDVLIARVQAAIDRSTP